MKQQDVVVVHPLRIVALSMAVSAAASLVVITLLRRLGLPFGRSPSRPIEPPVQPAISTVAPARRPDHFTEDLVVSGLIHTGTEIAHQDTENGRSPEGV